ncbi:MAG TPA: CBS domain-containing protein [Pyrinomonadaceae bacterium]|jgi:CBS domain-containing protein|nr:CBS domain-containing protein [Pyrinomonadaceae bacterium]
MKVKEIMTQNPACCTADDNLQSVAKLMVDHDCGCIPVVEDTSGNKPIGIVTDRDICCRAVAEGKNPLDLTAGDVMTGNVITVTPDMSVEECCNVMEDNQIRRVAVVDNSGACCGIVAQADIAVYADEYKTAEVVQEVSKAGA